MHLKQGRPDNNFVRNCSCALKLLIHKRTVELSHWIVRLPATNTHAKLVSPRGGHLVFSRDLHAKRKRVSFCKEWYTKYQPIGFGLHSRSGSEAVIPWSQKQQAEASLRHDVVCPKHKTCTAWAFLGIQPVCILVTGCSGTVRADDCEMPWCRRPGVVEKCGGLCTDI